MWCHYDVIYVKTVKNHKNGKIRFDRKILKNIHIAPGLSQRFLEINW